jgi:hypothetical protein
VHARHVVATALRSFDRLADQCIPHLLRLALGPCLVSAQVRCTVLLTLVHGGRGDQDEEASWALPDNSRPDNEVAHVATLQGESEEAVADAEILLAPVTRRCRWAPTGSHIFIDSWDISYRY